jgi:hypothetical protein
MKRKHNMNSNPVKFYFRIIVLFILFFGGEKAYSGRFTKHVEIQWTGLQKYYIDSLYSPIVASFTGAVYNEATGLLPIFKTTCRPSGIIGECEVTFANAVYRSADEMWQSGFAGNQLIKDTIDVHSGINEVRKETTVSAWLVPLRLNSASGHLEQLVSFDLQFDYKELTATALATPVYRDNSVLASGSWYKLEIGKAGIYAVTYDEIQNMGVNMKSVNPANIRLYGNPGGMLPQANKSFRYDDLQENAIRVVTAKSGVFAPGDYILFYGTSPVTQAYNILARRFEHVTNNYSDKTCYFLNFELGPGKRLGNSEQSTEPFNHESARFTDFVYYENDLYNLILSGSEWMGERLDNLRASFDLPLFSFPNADLSVPASIRFGVAAMNLNASFSIEVNGSEVSHPIMQLLPNDQIAQLYLSKSVDFSLATPQAQVKVTYNLPNSSAKGWLDFVDLNVVRQLTYTSGQMPFADPSTVGNGFVTRFRLGSAPSGLEIWEVTDPLNVKIVNATSAGTDREFTLATDTLRRFIASPSNQYYTPVFAGKIPNQNLHAFQHADMVIIAPDVFLSEARRLANFHAKHDNMAVILVSLQQIYNEFSSGSPDATAIRDFMRMLYNRSQAGETPRYLLLFGDGSYDNKNRLAINTNFIPTFQTKESFYNTQSYATDDYYGIYGISEGQGASGSLDIGIGRFPVATARQAKTAVDKSIYYAQNSPGVQGDWRNTLCFVADDDDSNTHINQAEGLAGSVWNHHKEYNIDKIYLDAYKQESFPGGQRYPAVNDAINNRVEKGALIVNYTGHGGEVGWAHERVLELSDINGWNNFDKMPVFFTATCEFSRFDDPGRISAGEQVFLNPAGGGVALFTTSRIANAGDNVELNQSFYDTVFSSNHGVYPRLGDIMAFSKNDNISSYTAIRNFVLLGDPALRLAYPENKVVTTSLNSKDVNAFPDTIRALSSVTLSGVIEGYNGGKLENFNGKISIKVFDKPSEIRTLANDPGSIARSFLMQKNVIYQGEASVVNGDFSFSFIVPRDIDYHFGLGKISYYADNGKTDAGGYYDSLVIGGDEKGHANDTEGPAIKLYINDPSFNSGDIVGENPRLLAYISDFSGINTVGNGIGHDIVAELDGNTNKSYILNDFFQADLDSYQKGTVRYHFFNLTEGPHTLKLKVWDVYNNSSEAVIDFIVSKSIELNINTVLAYPNPCKFADPINIIFKHNLFDNVLEVKIDIFNLEGMLVKSFGILNLESGGYEVGPIKWDGKDDAGNDLRAGMYIFRVRAKDRNDVTSVKSGKIIIVR